MAHVHERRDADAETCYWRLAEQRRAAPAELRGGPRAAGTHRGI